MCRKLVVTNKLGLGSRELGWETYSLPKGEVVEFTSRQLKDAIRTGSDEVYGLKVDEETGELVFDTEGFFTTNMMQTVYDVISSRYERTSFSEEKVKALLEMGIISGGATLQNGEIVVASMGKEKTAERKEATV